MHSLLKIFVPPPMLGDIGAKRRSLYPKRKGEVVVALGEGRKFNIRWKVG